MVAINYTTFPIAPDFKCGMDSNFTFTPVGGFPTDVFVFSFPAGVTGTNEVGGTYATTVTYTGNTTTTIYIRRETKDITDGWITFTYNGGGAYQIQLKSTCELFAILKHGESYCEDYHKLPITNSANKFTLYEYTTWVSGTKYYYNTKLGSFSTSDDGIPDAPPYQATYRSDIMQTSSDIFEAYFETINIVFQSQSIEDGSISMKVAMSPSVAQAKVTWASDTNTIYQEKVKTLDCGSLEQTGSFNNDDVRYEGKRQLIIKDVKENQRVANSVRFKIDAILSGTGLDDVAIHYIDVLPSGSLYIGGSDA